MMVNLKQLVPSAACLKCDVCCRYPEKKTTFAPYFFSEEIKDAEDKSGKFPVTGKIKDKKPFPVELGGSCICQFFTPENNGCRIYESRPFDCRLYPFMVTYDRDYGSVILALDTKCPYIRNKADSEEARRYIDYLADTLEEEGIVEEMNSNKAFINDFQEDSIFSKRLENLSERICFVALGLKSISLKDKILFDDYFSKVNAPLSSFSFQSIYIWSGVLNILWKEINDALCVFAGNSKDYFLLLPPLSREIKKGALEAAFGILSRMNGTDFPLRIENVPQGFFAEGKSRSLKLKKTSCEYVYLGKVLAELKGEKLKTKRKLVNNFVKSHRYNYRKLEEGDIFECLELYGEWAKNRLEKIKDDYFRFLIEDSYFAQKKALTNLGVLNLEGRVIELEGVGIRGYSVGFPLNKDTFVILFETADLNIKGLAQFIFKRFPGDLKGYKYINALGDSGLKNLERVKKSYRPFKTIPIFTALLNANSR